MHSAQSECECVCFVCSRSFVRSFAVCLKILLQKHEILFRRSVCVCVQRITVKFVLMLSEVDAISLAATSFDRELYYFLWFDVLFFSSSSFSISSLHSTIMHFAGIIIIALNVARSYVLSSFQFSWMFYSIIVNTCVYTESVSVFVRVDYAPVFMVWTSKICCLLLKTRIIE